MGIKRFFDKTVVVMRLSATTGVQKQFNTTATVDGAVQELDQESRTEYGLSEDRAWIGYFDIEDDAKLKEGDKITLSGVDYKVIEKTKKDYGINQHIEIIMVEYAE